MTVMPGFAAWNLSRIARITSPSLPSLYHIIRISTAFADGAALDAGAEVAAGAADELDADAVLADDDETAGAELDADEAGAELDAGALVAAGAGGGAAGAGAQAYTTRIASRATAAIRNSLFIVRSP